MKKYTTDELRNMFLEYFKQQGHMIEPGASLVPHEDPTLLWINSGVAALKKYFDGSVTPSNRRIANAQKSIRTNDIENVGKTARHHTFFEMLGNFSIGDYFKKEAIEFGWEFLTSEEWIGFDKDKMYISVHTDDDEAYQIWTEHIGVDPKKILKTDGNYWEIGEGPSGPNSEIFYDRGSEFDPDDIGERLFFEEIDNDRYLEVWNIVFSQYDAVAGVDRKDYKELPQKNIDTGMGLERLACLVQGVETNFEIDVFMHIIKAIEKKAKYPYEGEYKESYKIISDHIRTIVFALSDGAMFSNEGRGYVLRRLLRRSVRHGKQLGIEGNFLYELVPVVAEAMGQYYDYLFDKVDYNQKLILNEEERFSKTLVEGEEHLAEALKECKGKELDGKTVFKLYDTYGFPFELTEEIALESGYQIDYEGFKAEMEAQRERARNAREAADSMGAQSEDLMRFEEESNFVGYQQVESEATIIAIFEEGTFVEETDQDCHVIFDQTPFYAESGGQVGDTGVMSTINSQLAIINTIKAPNGQHLHTIENSEILRVGDKVTLSVNQRRREHIKRNHSSVHLLHAALKDIVGDHVAQAGSFVSDEYARLDFNNFEALSQQQLEELEARVNAMIDSASSVEVELMPLNEAKESGAIAMFDEKYDDLVRVVTMGEHSKELCGGTHVSQLSELGVFKILSEESVGSGIRRLNFTTSQNVYHYLLEREELIEKVKATTGVKQEQQLIDKINELKNENKKLQESLASFTEANLKSLSDDLMTQSQAINGYHVVSKVFDDKSADDLKTLVDLLRNQKEKVLAILATTQNDRLVLVAGCHKDLTKEGIHCGNIVKTLAQKLGGNGGGRPDFAQAGGKNTEDAQEMIENYIKELN